MHPRRRTIHEFLNAEEYFKQLCASSKFTQSAPSTNQPRCSASAKDMHPSSGVKNIKILAKKIKLVVDDQTQLKFSNLEGQVGQKSDIASTPKFAHTEKTILKSDNTQAETQHTLTERVRVYVDKKLTSKDQWLKLLDDQYQEGVCQLDFELNDINQNKNIGLLVNQDSFNIFDEKQILNESQLEDSDIWDFEQSQKVSEVSDLVNPHTQNILQALEKSVQTSNEDNV